MEFFKGQLAIIERNRIKDTIVLGDFNLDARMQFRLDYRHKLMYDYLNDFTTNQNLEQIVDFPTWSRTISNVRKDSILDHIYTSDSTMINKCFHITPLFGDHLIVVVDLLKEKFEPTSYTCRDWRNYDPNVLANLLSQSSLIFDHYSVQQYWNCLENVLINATNASAPLITIKFTSFKSQKIPQHIKAKINKRGRLLKKIKVAYCPIKANTIKTLNKEIKCHFFQTKRDLIKRKISNNNNNGIWKAVKIAKNQGTDDIPYNLTIGNTDVAPEDKADAFAQFFSEKTERLVGKSRVDQNVYNGKNKLLVVDRFFMTEEDIRESLSSLNPKKCEGYDRIPVKILYDARELLTPTLTVLFKKIYEQNQIPDQWKMSKITPIHKKSKQKLY